MTFEYYFSRLFMCCGSYIVKYGAENTCISCAPKLILSGIWRTSLSVIVGVIELSEHIYDPHSWKSSNSHCFGIIFSQFTTTVSFTSNNMVRCIEESHNSGTQNILGYNNWNSVHYCTIAMYYTWYRSGIKTYQKTNLYCSDNCGYLQASLCVHTCGRVCSSIYCVRDHWYQSQ